jgi:GTPase SAR1 family protein
MYNRPYRFEFYDTASPDNYTLLKPAVIILCYSIADPASLASLKGRWQNEVDMNFNFDEQVPVVVLGLQRDVRNEEDYSGRVRQQAAGGEVDDYDVVLNGRTFVYPQEGLKVAQEMRCDRYCECSALTGELCREVIEDISRTAANTTTEKGGRSEGNCSVM